VLDKLDILCEFATTSFNPFITSIDELSENLDMLGRTVTTGRTGGDFALEKKYACMAVLVSSILATGLFIVIPTRSSSGPGEYNPWADINGDGIVDIFDALLLANSFAKSGIPINKTETLADVQLRLDRIEQFLNQSSHVEFLSFTGGGAYVPHYYFGIAGSWNASKLFADPIADRLNASISGMRNVSISYTEYADAQFFVEPQLSQSKGYGQIVQFWYDRVTPPDGPLTQNEIETVRTIIEDYLARP